MVFSDLHLRSGEVEFHRWARIILFISAAYNSSPIPGCSFSPFQFIFGRRFQLPSLDPPLRTLNPPPPTHLPPLPLPSSTSELSLTASAATYASSTTRAPPAMPSPPIPAAPTLPSSQAIPSLYAMDRRPTVGKTSSSQSHASTLRWSTW